MASRRDELNAYTFAKKRLLAAFLQPTPSGTEEGAPRPLRAVIPGLIIGVVIMAGFGAWGMFKPKAPEGWDNVAEKVIIGSESTTRYVVLKTDGRKQLHPVLNLASAKLLLQPDKFEIVEVDEETLDNGEIPHGATIGIPYAPDRLPDPKEATKQKTWAVCTQPGDGGTVQRAVFVFADREKKEVGGKNRLRGGQVMYVVDSDGQRYLVDHKGKAYPLADREKMLRTLVGNAEPQLVTSDWLRTLERGDLVDVPDIDGMGDPAGVPGSLDSQANRVGMVLKAKSGAGVQNYLVMKGAVRPVSQFMADLLLGSVASADVLEQRRGALEVSPGAFTPSDSVYGANQDWPEKEVEPVNKSGGSRDTLCNVLRKTGKGGDTTLSTWAAEKYPKELPNGATSAYVTPGSGLLFRQVKGGATASGGVFLVTDTGLRYAVQGNRDSGQDDAGIGSSDKKKQQVREEGNRAQIRLGYKDTEPVPVPASWSTFLPIGPRLSTTAARQPQGS